MNPATPLDHVTCARFPATSLGSLAGFRRVEQIEVLEDGDNVWVFWVNDDDQVIRAVLPIPGVELFERRGDDWYQPGRSLPSFAVPAKGERVPLSWAVTPEPCLAIPPGLDEMQPSWLKLSRNNHPRPTTALLCTLGELAQWVELALSSDIEAILGAFRDDQVLLFGPKLPTWPGATRYWGHRVLVPIGFEPSPNLPEDALLESLGSSGREVLWLVPVEDCVEVESIPFETFRPLSRAGVRLALGARS